jgi:hypothetical protein
MAYGIQLINQFGEEPLASGGLFFEKSSGTLSYAPVDVGYYGIWNGVNSSEDAIFNPSLLRGVSRGGRRFMSGMSYRLSNVNRGLYLMSDDLTTALDFWDRGSPNSIGSTADSRIIQWSSGFSGTDLTSSWSGYGASGTRRRREPLGITGTTGNSLSNMQEVFFKLNSNGIHMFGSWYNPYNNFFGSTSKGIVAWCQSWYADGDGQQYKVLTTEKPSVSGSYGMEVMDASGSTIYDSRYTEKAARIKDHIHISASDMSDCLSNGTVYNYPLRQNISNPYIGGDTLNSSIRVLSGKTSTWTYPRLQVVTISGVDNLRLSRTRYRYVSKGSMSGPTAQNFQRGTYLIADL